MCGGRGIPNGVSFDTFFMIFFPFRRKGDLLFKCSTNLIDDGGGLFVVKVGHASNAFF